MYPLTLFGQEVGKPVDALLQPRAVQRVARHYLPRARVLHLFPSGLNLSGLEIIKGEFVMPHFIIV